MIRAFEALVRRDLRLAWRRPAELALPLGFVAGGALMFALGVGPEPQTLRALAPGVAWVLALLASLLSMPSMFAGDWQDGSLDQMLLSPLPLAAVAGARALAHWLLHGLPLVLAGPLVAAMLGLAGPALAVLALSLLLGTPVLSLLGTLGAALTVGTRGGGLLLLLLVLPLAVPTLIFGAGAVTAAEAGLAAAPHLSLLGAVLITGTLLLPWAAGAALRIAAL
ncbi:MAG: heme exporter protein CcmB [Rubrivivax sp.]|nr:heme exporter protein CcmB [Rubrivivax sp.]